MLFVASQVEAAEIAETFTTNPSNAGWMIEGTDAFEWDEAAGNLRVSWDSEQPNGFFHFPLPVTLTETDDFEMRFDVMLEVFDVGFDSGSLYAYQVLSLGLINTVAAFDEGFRRSMASHSPNLLEFDYFPDTGFTDTVAIVAVDAASNYATPSHNFPLTMETGVTHSVSVAYTAADRTVRTTMTVGGEPFAAIKDVVLPPPDQFAGFAFDAFSILAFRDFTPWGWMTATGVVDNVRLILPDPPRIALELARDGDGLVARFETSAGWRFRLQRSGDLRGWSDVGQSMAGAGRTVEIDGIASDGDQGFLRVKAVREP